MVRMVEGKINGENIPTHGRKELDMIADGPRDRHVFRVTVNPS